ncbi:MAG: hypothetical protein ACLPTZ_13620 [Beijerinckiaceae bacterium]
MFAALWNGGLKTTRNFEKSRGTAVIWRATIPQDFTKAVRPVFFQTEFEEWLYATDGGTLFIVQLRDKNYALTCGHVFKDFAPGRLFIPSKKYAQKGDMPAPIGGISYPSLPKDGAEGTDISDICVIEFTDELPPDFFKDSAYVVDETMIATASFGHELLVAGVLKEKTSIVASDIAIGYCNLQLRDMGPTSDPFLRRAFAVFAQTLFGRGEFETVTGISGSPVFDRTANALCGVVIRGGMTGPMCHLYYLDASDILRLLRAVYDRAEGAYYEPRRDSADGISRHITALSIQCVLNPPGGAASP